ncbi:uncharacterized protein BO88DRAFT_32382 [Aspergillus vadensis CBS 113365]|uniref:RING-type domain-containing protein n=1 Tax=Aspergillus vadensis (strain CBS 113365 / IMI 142717 / IBT 24658) TaxID=1448311 RepID=A0A319BP66_ASPVC|nr:hypothetical protein BO88DRAFT_32382 [Aspergillus vadensis CBS 113365]PYH75186.1 hypothetical protein BO88DRAFT_32382 [Aspergillus vadensis CBS 113365]
MSLSGPSAVTSSVSEEVQTRFLHHSQISEAIGGLPTLPYPLPGSSFDNSIDIDALRNTGNDNSIISHDLQRPGDSIENPIDLDTVSAATSDVTELIASLPVSLAQTELMPDGRSLETYYECKICYCKVVDLVLGCGHTYCYNCFNNFFHDSVLRQARRRQALAYEYLAGRQCKPLCPYCMEYFPGSIRTLRIVIISKASMSH